MNLPERAPVPILNSSSPQAGRPASSRRWELVARKMKVAPAYSAIDAEVDL